MTVRARDLLRGAVRLLPKAEPLLETGLHLLLAEPGTRRSIPWYLERAARRWPDHDAVRTHEGALTYRELSERSNRFAHGLLRRGVRPGTTVALLAENRAEYLLCLAAVLKAGAVCAVINTQQRREVLAHSLRVAAPVLALVGDELLGAFDEAAAGGAAPPVVRVPRAGDAATSAKPDPREALSDLERGEPATLPWPAEGLRLGDTAYLVFTSGTTGDPKAARMSHQRWEKAAHVFGGACLGLRPGQAIYAPLPLYHNNALTIAWGSALVHGATLLTRPKFSARHFMEDCVRLAADAFIYIGEIPAYLLETPPSPFDRAHKPLKALGNGLRPEAWHRFRRRFAVDEIYEFYGASEMNISFLNLFNVDESVGVCPASWALVAYDVDTGLPRRDARGRLTKVPRGEPGLLVAEVTHRYPYDGYSDAAASEAKLVRSAFRRGDVWFVSGDLLRDVGYGHLAFVDRLGDTFRWKGENVATLEVERACQKIPGVNGAVVYGVSVPGHAGRAGMAALVTEVAFDPSTALRVLARELPSYAVPLVLRLVPGLDHTSTFKKRKGALRDEGFDPRAVTDPLWLRVAGEYVPLDGSLYARLAAGELKI